MAYKMYLLDVSLWLQENDKKQNMGSVVAAKAETLLLQDDSAKKVFAFLCPERREKVLRCRTVTGQAHRLGAGLLLQYIRHVKDVPPGGDSAWEKECKAVHITPQQITEVLEKEPVDDFTIAYGEKGKPYFKDEELYFSLSHSGNYVLCAVSREEIGADIQECKAGVQENLAKRVLAEEEWRYWTTLESGFGEADLYFYEKWTEKEARGKLTGEGILSEMRSSDDKGHIHADHSFEIPGYCISVCQYCKI